MSNDLLDYFKKSPKRQSEYIVRPGDTLYNIAKTYGVTVQDLINANDLESTMIYPNQILVISKTVPSGAMYFMEYVVKTDDTISSIAEAFDIDTNEIGRYNDVTKLVLAEGQTLQIPTRYKVYVIKDEDTIENVLKKNDMSFEEFFELNSKSLLQPGMTVYVR
jgi:LysM repeat protein